MKRSARACTALRAACAHSCREQQAAGTRLLPSRSGSTFSYLKPGPAPNLLHELVFDENEKFVEWKSDTIPRVAPPHLAQSPLHQQRAEYDSMVALLKKDPNTFLLQATLARSRASGEAFPMSDEELKPYLAPPSDEEKQKLSTLAGRVAAAEAVQQQIKELVHLLRAAEAQELDSGARDAASPYTAEQMQHVAAAAHLAAARAGVKVLRQLSLLNAAHLASFPADQRDAAEKSYLSSVGIVDPLAPGVQASRNRSPRIPLEAWLRRDEPLDTPRKAEEIRDGLNYLDYEQTKLQMMEHRDRMEAGSRTALPASLAEGAPQETIAAAARALEANPSLSRQDREYMLQFYADAVNNKPSAWDISAEKAAFMDPQPQWGFYDPALVQTQDDAKDALYGRGRFSAYRGSLAKAERVTPSMIGEAPIFGVGRRSDAEIGSSGAPPEVVEEAAAAVQDMASRIAAESAIASAAVTAALERSMGLKPRKAGAVPPPSSRAGPAFWQSYAKGARVAGSVPTPPVNLPYKEPERAKMEAETAAASGKATAKGGKDSKGKPAAGGKKK